MSKQDRKRREDCLKPKEDVIQSAKKWRTPTQADLQLFDNKGTLLSCKVRNSLEEAWISGHILTNIDLVGQYPFQTYDITGKYRQWKWCVIEDDTLDPKYLISSSVTCSYLGLDKQCIVLHYNKDGREGMPEYTVYPIAQPGNTYACREDQLKPWVEPVQDNQTYTNEQGGKQSFVAVRFDCIPPVVLRLLAQCLGFGARKYGKDNWKKIEQWDHLNHAMNHINEWNRGDRSEPHLVNAMARITFALWQAIESKDQPDTYIHPDEVK